MTQSNIKGTALVTGASTGIGAVYADRLAHRGYDLILVARDEAKLRDLAVRLCDHTGVSVSVQKADLGTGAGRAAVEQRLREDQSITMLVNNAGIAAGGTTIETDPDLAESVIALNVVAASRLAISAARAFKGRDHGTIVNIASVLALAPERFNGVYDATKAFLLSLSQAMQTELAATGVWVQAVLPGATRTEIWGKMGADIDSVPASMLMGVDEMVDAALKGLDLGELVTIPSLPEIADWKAFETARLALGPNLSRQHAAARYHERPAP